MARNARSPAAKAIAHYWAEDALWGVPESPEFSSVQRLMNEFQAHADYEEKWLSNYQSTAQDASDPLVRFLLELIVTDERGHHELTKRMVAKLKDELAWTRSEGLTRRVYETTDKRAPLLVSVQRLLDAERQGIQEYERLRKASQGLCRDVFALLYRTMIDDSHKHIAILAFLRKKLKESGKGSRKRNK